jgi:hypothetical protein
MFLVDCWEEEEVEGRASSSRVELYQDVLVVGRICVCLETYIIALRVKQDVFSRLRGGGSSGGTGGGMG